MLFSKLNNLTYPDEEYLTTLLKELFYPLKINRKYYENSQKDSGINTRKRDGKNEIILPGNHPQTP